MCARAFCSTCGEEMIHRDNRRAGESSCALNHIIQREGPRLFTIGDVDNYAMKLIGSRTLLRIIEHKQPTQELGKMQAKFLACIKKMFRFCMDQDVFGLRLDSRSGVFIIRGELGPRSKGEEVDFLDKQEICDLDGTVLFAPKTRRELFDWLNGSQEWTSRDSRGRYGGNDYSRYLEQPL